MAALPGRQSHPPWRFFPEQAPAFDPQAPADLLPKFGVYPTERVFFRKLVIDVVPEPGRRRAMRGEPIDLANALSAPAGFGRLATGALLTFSQSWFSEGALPLGQLLHSTSLAPGESTRIAVVDWSRRTRAAASEDISETELLSNTVTHSRAMSEVTNASATEFQSGRSSVCGVRRRAPRSAERQRADLQAEPATSLRLASMALNLC